MMRLTVLATAVMGSVAALVGFSGVALASATVDLIWIDTTDTACIDADRRDCPQLGTVISSVAVTDNITLGVIVTAGPGGVIAASVSVNYGDALPVLSVTNFAALTTPLWLPNTFVTPIDEPPFIDAINALAQPGINSGIGLPAGQTAYLGTVTFHKDVNVNGVYEIAVGTDGPRMYDAVLNLESSNVSSTTTFNSAFLVSIGDPSGSGCTDSQGNSMQIEVNTLRAGGKTVSAGPNQTIDVTAKARILKGTAVPGTTIDTTLTIEAVDGTTVIGTNSTAFGAVQLQVGKGGKGDKLTVDVPQCTTGFIEFVATFLGTDGEGDVCEGTRTLRRECR